jgi:hypothetical protein
MAHDVAPRLYPEDGFAIHAARAQAPSSAHNRQRKWEALGREERLAIIERQLRDFT